MKKAMSLCFAAFAMATLTACISIDYDGISDPPLPSGEKVTLYFSADQLPVKEYTVLGTLTASAGTTYSSAEVESKIRNFARDKGANGFLITDVDRIYAGMARSDQINNQASYRWIVDDSSGNSFRYFREDMLDYSKRSQPEKPVYDITIKAKLLRLPEAAK